MLTRIKPWMTFQDKIVILHMKTAIFKIALSLISVICVVDTIWASVRENLSSEVWEQQRRRPACASAQSDQRLCYAIFEKYHM